MRGDECCTGDSWVSVHNGLFHVALNGLNHCGLRERNNDIGTKGITLYRGTEIREGGECDRAGGGEGRGKSGGGGGSGEGQREGGCRGGGGERRCGCVEEKVDIEVVEVEEGRKKWKWWMERR